MRGLEARKVAAPRSPGRIMSTPIQAQEMNVGGSDAWVMTGFRGPGQREGSGMIKRDRDY